LHLFGNLGKKLHYYGKLAKDESQLDSESKLTHIEQHYLKKVEE